MNYHIQHYIYTFKILSLCPWNDLWESPYMAMQAWRPEFSPCNTHMNYFFLDQVWWPHNVYCSVGTSSHSCMVLEASFPLSLQILPTQRVSKGKPPKSPVPNHWQLLPWCVQLPNSLPKHSVFDHIQAQTQLMVHTSSPLSHNLENLPAVVAAHNGLVWP